MADPISLITANPDTNNPTDFAAQADLAWTQLKTAIPQINAVAEAMNLNDVSDTSISINTLGTGSKNFNVSIGKSFLPGQILNIADTNNPGTNIMFGVVTSYSGDALAVNVLQFLGTSGTSISAWTISLGAMPPIPAVTSELKLTTVTGQGSTNTKIFIFSTVAENTATADLSYDNSATLGTSITVLTKGWYRVRHQSIGTSPAPGLTKNCTQLSTVVTSLSDINQLVARAVQLASSTSAYFDSVIYLEVNDMIRLQDGGGVITTGNANSYLHIQKLSLQGTGGGGGGGGGAGGAPVDAQYIVASSDGTLTNERLAVSSASVTVETGIAGNISFKRAALTGAITAPADSNVTSLSNNSTTNAILADMPMKTVKGNSSGSTADPQDLTLTGGLSMASTALKSKGSFSFPCTFSTTLTMSDPGADGVRFNSATIASIAEVSVSSTLGGRSVGSLLNTFTGAQIGFMSNNSTSTAFVIFNVTATDNNGTGDFYTFTVTPLSGLGVMPANNEELQLFYWPSGGAGLSTQDVLDMLVLRRNAQNQIIDEIGNVISGSPRVADYAALVALSASAYDGYAVNVQAGLNNPFFASNGNAFSPLNGQYVQERSVIPGNTYVVPANITWTAANNGSGKVRLTASGAGHGITETNAEGSYLYLISGGTGWTAGTSHRITPTTGYVSATELDLDTNYTASMGVPVFAKMGASVADEIPLLDITLPVLRNTTEVEVNFSIEYSDDATTGSRRVKSYLDGTELTSNNQTSANFRYIPYRWGFRNQAATNSQRGFCGSNATGLAGNTLMPATAAVDTSVTGKVFSIRAIPSIAGLTVRIGSYSVFIRG